MNSLTNLHSQDDHRINVLEHFLNETHHKRQNHNESQFGEANFIKGNLESPERSFTHSQSQSQIVSPVFASPTSSPINLYSTLSDIDAKSKKNYSAMVSQKEILNLSGTLSNQKMTSFLRHV